MIDLCENIINQNRPFLNYRSAKERQIRCERLLFNYVTRKGCHMV